MPYGCNVGARFRKQGLKNSLFFLLIFPPLNPLIRRDQMTVSGGFFLTLYLDAGGGTVHEIVKGEPERDESLP